MLKDWYWIKVSFFETSAMFEILVPITEMVWLEESKVKFVASHIEERGVQTPLCRPKKQ